MAHVAHVVDALHLKHVGLVTGEVGVGLDGCRHLVEFGSLFQLHIDHAAMDALTQGDGHRERILHTGLRTDADAMAHRHAGTEVGVGKAFRGEALHEGAHDRVAARIPTGGDDAHGVGFLIDGHQVAAVVANHGVDVERVDSIDAQWQNLTGVFFTRTGGGG